MTGRSARSAAFTSVTVDRGELVRPAHLPRRARLYELGAAHGRSRRDRPSEVPRGAHKPSGHRDEPMSTRVLGGLLNTRRLLVTYPTVGRGAGNLVNQMFASSAVRLESEPLLSQNPHLT